MLRTTKILSPSAVKRLVEEQGRFIKIDERVRSCKLQRNWELQVFILQSRDENSELNFEQQFRKDFAKSKFGTTSCKFFAN